MLILVGALLVSYLVPLAMYFYLVSLRTDDAEYKKDCFTLLWKGVLLVFPVFGFSLVCNLLFSLLNINERFPIVELIFSNFVLKAFSEELMKFLNARKIINKNSSSVSFLDLMVYTTISAIGFELLEAIVYMFSTNVGQILVRGFTNMHAGFGLIMGYFIAKGIKKGHKNPYVLGILVSTLIHGAYDLFLDDMFDDTFLIVVPLLVCAICVIVNIYAFFFFRKKQNDPYYTGLLFPEKAAAALPEEGTQAETTDSE